ncbi:MAG: FKBP-type peptidyl-prolyl cis-trans isomerase [Bacteroidaceae bacterium]|nr:FKBP-type peptidyl-prolyl cis-trans isomerase [Bacteroidaceae bacterium]
MGGRLVGLAVLLVSAAMIAGCAASSQEDEFANWRSRNDNALKEIAAVTAGFEAQGVTKENAAPGQTFRIVSARLDSTKTFPADNYVYCTILKENPAKGQGGTPLYTDSVWIHYRGQLIPSASYSRGFIFDQSYITDTLDLSINSPSAFVVSKLVVGMTTVLQEMHPGDYWRVFIPYKLGYDKNTSNNIPKYSNLIFDVMLDRYSYRTVN